MIIGLAILVLGLLITAYYALALFYHWLTYIRLFPVVTVMMVIYSIGTAFFLYASFLAFSAL